MLSHTTELGIPKPAVYAQMVKKQFTTADRRDHRIQLPAAPWSPYLFPIMKAHSSATPLP